MLDLITGPLDRSQYKVPDDVALAALEFLTSDSPKRRYMVVPNQFEARITIQQALRELVQLNEGQPYTYGRDELVRMLDEALAGARPPTPQDSSESVSSGAPPVVGLHEAALTGNLEAVRRHIEAGADLDEKEPSGGSTPLMIAAAFGHTDVAKALIEAGADLDRQNNDGSTALFSAAFLCRTEIVAALLEAGADKGIPNSTGSTALDAVTRRFEEVKGMYDFLATVLGPFGLELDYERLRTTRPVIAEMLR
jgi:hypothetical protein